MSTKTWIALFTATLLAGFGASNAGAEDPVERSQDRREARQDDRQDRRDAIR
jgi:hypothetical protein